MHFTPLGRMIQLPCFAQLSFVYIYPLQSQDVKIMYNQQILYPLKLKSNKAKVDLLYPDHIAYDKSD